MENLQKKEQTFSRIDVMNTPFSIIKDNKTDKCKISIGMNLATEREFENIEAARKYINKRPWELIVNCVFAMYINIKQAEEMQEALEEMHNKNQKN